MNPNSYSSSLSSSKSELHNDNDLAAQSLSLTKSSDRFDLPTQEQKSSIALIYVDQARVYFQENNHRKAILACKNALDLAPKTTDAYQILGDILYSQGKEAEALGIYAKALTINPNLTSVYESLGNLYKDKEDWHKALDYYQKAVNIDPECGEIYRNLAQVWEELGDTEKALASFCRAIDLEPQTLAAEDYFSFGQELYDRGKLKEASILFVHGIRLNPDAEAELATLVEILEELEEWQTAVVYYHQLISLPEINNSTQILEKNTSNLARETRETSKSDRSLTPNKPIKKLLAKYNSKPMAHKMIAKETQSSISSLSPNTAQKLWANTPKNSQPKPDSALSWNNLGTIYAQKQRWKKAISCYQKSLQLEPNFAKSYRNLARVYHQTGEPLKASFYWYEAYSIEPDLVTPAEYLSLAEKLIEYQQQDKAIACLRRTIELDPHCDRAQEMLDKLTINKK